MPRVVIAIRYIDVDFTFGLPDYVRIFVKSRFTVFSSSDDGLSNFYSYGAPLWLKSKCPQTQTYFQRQPTEGNMSVFAG